MIDVTAVRAQRRLLDAARDPYGGDALFLHADGDTRGNRAHFVDHAGDVAYRRHRLVGGLLNALVRRTRRRHPIALRRDLTDPRLHHPPFPLPRRMIFLLIEGQGVREADRNHRDQFVFQGVESLIVERADRIELSQQVG
jgi:hypothetical protein